jgi:hypothetical protein
MLLLKWSVDLKAALRKLAEGVSLWDSDLADMVKFRDLARRRILVVKYSSHKTEFFVVGEIQLCTTSSRGEALSSSAAMTWQFYKRRIDRTTVPKTERK